MGLMGLMVVDVGRSIPANLRLFALVFLLSFLLSSFTLSRLFVLVFVLSFLLSFLLSSFCSRLVVGTICTYLRTVVRAIRWLIWFERFSATERP